MKAFTERDDNVVLSILATLGLTLVRDKGIVTVGSWRVALTFSWALGIELESSSRWDFFGHCITNLVYFPSCIYRKRPFQYLITCFSIPY